jgi:hypothetical protein
MRWNVYLEFEVFGSSRDVMVYEEMIKADSEEAAIRIATENFKRKMEWLIANPVKPAIAYGHSLQNSSVSWGW